MTTNDVVYRGYRLDRVGGGMLVVVEVSSELVGPLPHQIKHSPTGMAWGYTGSGPADLARSLLIHAFGNAARCAVYDGTNEVVYDNVTGGHVLARLADGDKPRQGDDAAGRRFSERMPYTECDDGWAVMPSMYQQFKVDVVAQLPESGWTLSRTQVLAWLSQHREHDAR